MAKIKANAEKKKFKTLKQKGVTLDPSMFKQHIVDCTLDDALQEFAHYWAIAESWGDQLTPKRKVRVLEKAMTVPCLPDTLIPLRMNDNAELNYYYALTIVRDRVLLVQELQYNDLMAEEAKRQAAKAAEAEAKSDEK